MEETKPADEPAAVLAEVPRRKLLEWIVGVINLGVFVTIVGPVLGFIASPLRTKRKPGVWVPVLDQDELAEGITKGLTYELEDEDGYMISKRKYGLYLMRKGSRIAAYDPTCPHLGCHVEYKELKKRYICPCHGGTFDEEGNRISGPPPRGLTKLATKVENGKIWIYKA